ncbi:hypothetical protein [Christiangramia fulva]|nr:hypothetical protein [Christiangramia fulva]
MFKIMRKLMISCKKAGILTEKKIARKLNAIETVELILHTSVCKACKQYEVQSNFIEKSLNHKIESPEKRDLADLKKKIKKSLPAK